MRFPSFIALLLAVSIMGLQSCGKVIEPKFKRLERFEVKKFSLQEATVGFDATFLNLNNFGVNVKEAVLDIYVDSIYLGKFTQPRDIAVQSATEFSIPLEGSISLSKVLTSEWKSIVGKEVLLRANGGVKVGKAGVFVNKNVSYQGRHKLDMYLLKNPAAAGFK